MIHGKSTLTFWPFVNQNMGTYIRPVLVNGYANEQPAHTRQMYTAMSYVQVAKRRVLFGAA